MTFFKAPSREPRRGGGPGKGLQRPPPPCASQFSPTPVAWPLELGLGTHNPRFVAWPLELGFGSQGALSAMEESVQATPTPLEGKEATRPQPSMATPTEEDTRPKVLIRAKWRKVPDGYPAHASGQLERDQLFINDLSKQLVAELRAACQFNPNPGAKPKSRDTKTDLIYNRAFCNYL